MKTTNQKSTNQKTNGKNSSEKKSGFNTVNQNSAQPDYIDPRTRQKYIIGIVLALLVVHLLMAMVLRFSLERQMSGKIPKGAIRLNVMGINGYAILAHSGIYPVNGTVVNGKGEEKVIDAKGMKVSEFIDSEAFAEAVVTAKDDYSAVITSEDIDNAYLILEEDGSSAMVVFGDSDSKRNVKNVVSIEAR